MYDKKNWRWICPDTKTVYDLSHMRSFTTTFDVKLTPTAEPTAFDCQVSFSNHCFSKTRKPGDHDNQVLDAQAKKGRQIEERVFCPVRWDFSLRLPGIIRDLAWKECLQGGNREIIYRQEDKSAPGRHDGWYVCLRVKIRPDQPKALDLSVRSAHYRTNRPSDIRRHGSNRFVVLLAKLVNQKEKR